MVTKKCGWNVKLAQAWSQQVSNMFYSVLIFWDISVSFLFSCIFGSILKSDFVDKSLKVEEIGVQKVIWKNIPWSAVMQSLNVYSGSQTVDNTQTVLKTLNVDVTNNGYEKDDIKNPTAEIHFFGTRDKGDNRSNGRKTETSSTNPNSFKTKKNSLWKAQNLKRALTDLAFLCIQKWPIKWFKLTLSCNKFWLHLCVHNMRIKIYNTIQLRTPHQSEQEDNRQQWKALGYLIMFPTPRDNNRDSSPHPLPEYLPPNIGEHLEHLERQLLLVYSSWLVLYSSMSSLSTSSHIFGSSKTHVKSLTHKVYPNRDFVSRNLSHLRYQALSTGLNQRTPARTLIRRYLYATKFP